MTMLGAHHPKDEDVREARDRLAHATTDAVPIVRDAIARTITAEDVTEARDRLARAAACDLAATREQLNKANEEINRLDADHRHALARLVEHQKNNAELSRRLLAMTADKDTWRSRAHDDLAALRTENEDLKRRLSRVDTKVLESLQTVPPPPNSYGPQISPKSSSTTITGRKDDHEKLRYDLLPRAAEEAVVKVLTYGARKYAPDNWRKVPEGRERYHAAARRHIAAWARGEELDTESGLSHLAHAACCLMFLLELPAPS